MERALEQARLALDAGEVPVGAVVVSDAGDVLSAAFNRREADNDPTAHAEVLALRAAGGRKGNWRLDGCTLVVTMEPCAMCAMAAVWARADRIVYGAADLKAGGTWSLYNIPQDQRLNHRCEIVHGVMEQECAGLLAKFFKDRRGS